MTEGREEGQRLAIKELAQKWLQKGKNIQEIAEGLDKTEEYVRELLK